MKCQNCNNDILNNEKFCPKCGSAINQNQNMNSNINQSNPNNIQPNNMTYQTNQTQNQASNPNSNNNTNIVKTIIIIAIVTVIVLVGLFWNLINSILNSSSDYDSSNSSFTDTETYNKTDTSKLEKNITTKYEIAKDGKVIALMKNSNNKDVKIKLETVFYDESNNPIGNDSNYLDLAANQETPCIIYNAPKTGFAKCEFNIEINEYNSFYEDCSEDFAIKDNDTERGLVVQATNNSSKTADTLKVIVIFYQNGKIVGSGLESEYDLDSGKTATFTITHPHDNNYKDVTYDSYKIYITASAEN